MLLVAVKTKAATSAEGLNFIVAPKVMIFLPIKTKKDVTDFFFLPKNWEQVCQKTLTKSIAFINGKP
jgi:hypothetical protein